MTSSPARILLVEPDPGELTRLAAALELEGFDPVTAATAAEARALLDHEVQAAILPDDLPAPQGGDLLAHLATERPDLSILLLTSTDHPEEFADCIRRGAHDALPRRGFQSFLPRVRLAVKHGELARRVEALLLEIGETGALVPGTDRRIVAARRRLQAAAAGSVPVALVGEAGTGRERSARWLHEHGPRRAARFVPLPPSGLSVEAVAECIEAARGGTILLHDPDTIDLAEQGLLAARLSENADVRVVAMLGADPVELTRQETLEPHLASAMEGVTVLLPPLRERPDDILMIAQQTLVRTAAVMGARTGGFSRGAADALRRHQWPGNLRELENRVLEAALSGGAHLEAADLRFEDTPPPDEDPLALPLAKARDGYEERYLTALLERTGGNVTRAAERAGLHRSDLYYLLRKYAIEPDQFRHR